MGTKIGFMGTRHGMTDLQIRAFRDFISHKEFSEFHHGDCRGSDDQAHSVVRDVKGQMVAIISHPAKWDDYRAYCVCDKELSPSTYNQRNKDIVDSTDILIATPDSKERKGSGTWITIRYARKRGKRIYIVHKSGRITLDE